MHLQGCSMPRPCKLYLCYNPFVVETDSEYVVISDAVLAESGFITDRAVRIKEGFITDIIPRGRINNNLTVLDFSGYRIAPCFCDRHLHFFQKNRENIEGIIHVLKSNGITNVCDGGDPHGYGMEVKKSLKDGLAVQTAGYALYKKGTYGRYIGRAVASLKEAEYMIESLYQRGADYIKVVNSGVFSPADATLSSGGFALAELKQIVAFAGARGLSVVCHANGDDAVRDAVKAGVSTIVHGLGVSSESLAIMAETEISFIPTLNAFASLASIDSEKQPRKKIREAVARHLVALMEASDRGVKVLPGSDAGPAVIPYGTSFLRELDLFEKAGMSIENILLSAAAERLIPGAPADFLILEGLNVQRVCRGGVFIND